LTAVVVWGDLLVQALGVTLASQVAQEEQSDQDHGKHQQQVGFDYVKKMHNERRHGRDDPGDSIPIKSYESFHRVSAVPQWYRTLWYSRQM
jgi:hypothetical protein